MFSMAAQTVYGSLVNLHAALIPLESLCNHEAAGRIQDRLALMERA
jgi:hypothetical protein